MSIAVKPLPELVKELPPYAQRVVRDFVEFPYDKASLKSRQETLSRLGWRLAKLSRPVHRPPTSAESVRVAE